MREGTAHWAFPGRAKLTGIHPLMQRVGFPPLAPKLIHAAVPVAVLAVAHAVVWFSFAQSSGFPSKSKSATPLWCRACRYLETGSGEVNGKSCLVAAGASDLLLELLQ